MIARSYFTITEVAKTLGVNTSKIRHYDNYFEVGLKRDHNGKRNRMTVDQVGVMATLCRLTKHLGRATAKTQYRKGNSERLLAILEPQFRCPETILEYGGCPIAIYE